MSCRRSPCSGWPRRRAPSRSNWDEVRQLGAQGTILANRGFATTSFLDQLGGLQVDASTTSPSMNLQKLIAGRGRFFLHRAPGLPGFLARAGATGKVRILPTVMFSAPLFMVMGPHVDPATNARVRRALEQLDKSGALAKMLLQWDENP